MMNIWKIILVPQLITKCGPQIAIQIDIIRYNSIYGYDLYFNGR